MKKTRLPPLEVYFGVGGCGCTDSAGGAESGFISRSNKTDKISVLLNHSVENLSLYYIYFFNSPHRL